MSATPLSGTSAIVTGASRGFGRGSAIALGRAGAQVVGVARTEADLAAVHDELGDAFTPVVGDVRDPDLAVELLRTHRPRTLVLNAGATPDAAPIQDQTWEGFSRVWETDVRHVFEFARQALLLPLDPGSTVISVSSGAALQGSPMSGGYAGAKATIGFINAYARDESARQGLGIDFVAVLPKLTPATGLGSTFVDAYAEHAGTTRESFLAGFGPVLTADQVGASVVELALAEPHEAPSFLLTAAGLAPIA